MNYIKLAKTIKCPLCGSVPGAICRKSSGVGLWGKPHKSRIKQAKEAEDKVIESEV